MEIARQCPGFLAARLHRSRGSNVRFRFIGMSMWESEQAFSDALGNPAFMATMIDLEIPASLSIYEIVAEVTADK
jgi:quinol monooxygenase YgiN